VALALTLIFGVYFASRFSLKEQLRLLAWTCWISIIFSFIFRVFGFGSSVATAQGVPGWYGIYAQKNDLGRVVALGALVFLFWGRAEPRHKGLARLGLATSLLLLALSQSMTTIIAIALVMILSPYFRWTFRRGMLWAAGGLSLLIAAGSLFFAWALTHAQEVTGALHKSPTLTGRVELWILCFVMALQRPWLGYGYGAFWLPGGEPLQRIWGVVYWKPLQAHNGLLELWLGLGLLGTALSVLVFLYYVARAVKFFRHGPDAVAAWPLMFLTLLFVEDLTVSEYLVQNSIMFVLFVAVALATRVSKTTPKASLVRAGLVPNVQPERLS
jgi:O-antigen ligase